jgi:uncharacterized protein
VTAAWLAGIVAASLVGSLHCIAMCGPLVGLHGGIRTTRLALVHAAGRLATYATLGAIAGLVGSAVDLAGRVGDVQRAATLLAATVLIAWGSFALSAAWARTRRPEARGPRSEIRALEPEVRGPRSEVRASAFSRGLVRVRTRRSARTRAALTGVLTGLLPCGWLWAFVVMAAGTGSALGGVAAMAAFWLGTVPAMVGLLALAGPWIARVRARVPAITAVALIVLGLGTLAVRWRDAGAPQVEAPHCHEPGHRAKGAS